MNPARWAVDRPVAVSMVLLIIVLLGAVALFALPMDLLPNLDLPYVTVTVELPGAGPEEVENLVVRPVEESVATVDGVAAIMSSSGEGGGFVFVEFDWGTDLGQATQEMRERLELLADALPEDAGTPRVQRFDPTDEPLMGIGLRGPGEISQVRLVAEDTVQPRLERLSGVASVQLAGVPAPQVRVEVDARQAATSGLGLRTIADLIQANNMNIPGGTLVDAGRRYDVRTTGALRDLDDLRALRIPSAAGSVRLDDMAAVDLTTPREEARIRLDGTPGIAFTILTESGANPVQVSNRVRSELEALEADLPAGYETTIFNDGAEFIRFSLRSVAENLVLGGLLAIGLLYYFLRHVRSTLTVAVAIPFSVIATFLLFETAGMTLNLVSMGGLALGIGMMVDNAIVVLESIFRNREEGRGPRGPAVLAADRHACRCRRPCPARAGSLTGGRRCLASRRRVGAARQRHRPDGPGSDGFDEMSPFHVDFLIQMQLSRQAQR